MRPARLIAIGCVVATLFCAACNGVGEETTVMKVPVRPEDVVDFWTLYNQNCSACHGGNGQNGPALDLANPLYQAVAADASLKKWITNGMPGTEMPAFGESAGGFLSEKQVDALVAGMRANWGKGGAIGATPPPYGANLRGDEKSGEQVYKEACISCHQKSGQRVSNASYLALVSDQSLRTITIAGRPDVGQPDWEHDRPDRPLTNEDVTNVVAYLASLRSATPGQPYPNAMK
ncbi:MAG TPA: c-type cytochrome [Candidatus Acidoferrales bacterium]|jgi:mono/diheme cytochrome c family protein|nr:c-type cytochrome [Candidatus Acidoferrales bacterium]